MKQKTMMKVVEDDQGLVKGSEEKLKKVPAPPSTLSRAAKAHYVKMGKLLLEQDRLKKIYLPALTIFAVNMEQFDWANKEIEKQNQEKPGAGYVQKFHSGAMNVSVFVSLREKAEKSLLQCCVQFGLDPKSEKGLKSTADNPNQLDLFDQFLSKQKHA